MITINELQELYNKILSRINKLSFEYTGFGEGDIIAQASKKRNQVEIDFLLECKKNVTDIAKIQSIK